ncbi:hypothetical protein IF2G_10925 [Cordyceps javanica]|nr:hypothetical protein IF2G_10925 [Cordyceps javanica]
MIGGGASNPACSRDEHGLGRYSTRSRTIRTTPRRVGQRAKAGSENSAILLCLLALPCMTAPAVAFPRRAHSRAVRSRSQSI